MMRYIRAFFKALVLTLRGETVASPTERQFPRLWAWLKQAQTLNREALAAAKSRGYDVSKCQNITVRVDGRDMSMDAILMGVHHHLMEEYPHLLTDLTEHSITGIYAQNMNDTYWLTRLGEDGDLPDEVRRAVRELGTHLEQIPPSNELQKP